jgi:ABC-type cobalamin transport system permease subunit
MREKGEKVKDAEERPLLHFLRLAELWAILMIGSALALAAAVIQLALA